MTDPEIGSRVAILQHEHCAGNTGTVELAKRAFDHFLGVTTIIVCTTCHRGGMIEDATQRPPKSQHISTSH